MRRGNRFLLILILILLGFSLWTILPWDSQRFGRSGFQLGLDIKGGTYLLYEADLTKKDPSLTDSQAMAAVENKIERRVNAYGVTEPVIQIQGNNRILVQLPGVKDINQALKLIGSVALLEFREEELNDSGGTVYLSDYLNQTSLAFFNKEETGSRIFVDSKGNLVAFLVKEGDGQLVFTDAAGNPIDIEKLKQGTQNLPSWIPAAATGTNGEQEELTGKYLKPNAQVVLNQQTNQPEVAFEWNSEGATLFEQITTRDLNKPLGIFLDNALISAPTVQAVITDKGVITGITPDEGKQLAIQLNSGSLDVPLKIIQQTDVNATLGADSLSRSLRAGLIGVALIMLFMIAYYRFPGFIAAVALCIYTVLLLAIFKLIPITLTLPGIAGFIISTGMAVDANVLIFERMKEELRAGRTAEAAVREGFHRAWPSIRDSNVSTMITCVILYWFGGTFGAFMVRGFALTLFLGVLVSMFSAITITRTFLNLFMGRRAVKGVLLRGAK